MGSVQGGENGNQKLRERNGTELDDKVEGMAEVFV